MTKGGKEKGVKYSISDDGSLVNFDIPEFAEFSPGEFLDDPNTKFYYSVSKQLGVPDLPVSLCPELQQKSHRADLLSDFVNVRDQVSLLEYLRNHDVPDFRWGLEIAGEDNLKVFPTRRFYASAATLYWLILMLDEVQKNAVSPRLRSWTQTQQYNDRIKISFTPTEHERESYLRHFSGIVTLTGEEIVNREFILPKNCDSNSEKTIIMSAKNYLAGMISELVKGISPTLSVYSNSNELVSQFGLTTAYEAARFALFEKACGSSTIRVCRNPHCPDPVYVAKSAGTRAPRIDRQYCNRNSTCQSWGYVHLGRVRAQKNTSKTVETRKKSE